MRARPVRDKIYLPVVRFGVNDSDWKFVIFAGLTCYTVPFLLSLKLLGFPLEIWMTIGGLLIAVAFFNFVRLGRRPFWLQHQLSALTKRSRHRRPIPGDWSRGNNPFGGAGGGAAAGPSRWLISMDTQLGKKSAGKGRQGDV